MNEYTKQAAAWVYRGIWRVVSGLFRVPEYPPTLPVEPGAFITSFHPSERYLSYLKLYFWVALLIIDVALLLGWIILYLSEPQLALWFAAPVLFLIVAPDIVAYIAIHLRYDTMWYVMTDRSLRTRRGIWIILEHTITFENVQNVHVRRGPIQYFFGISTIVVETAGAEVVEGHATGNRVIMEGIDNPEEIRRQIMDRVRASKSAGLGDERVAPVAPGESAFGKAHQNVLRDILDEVRRI